MKGNDKMDAREGGSLGWRGGLGGWRGGKHPSVGISLSQQKMLARKMMYKL